MPKMRHSISAVGALLCSLILITFFSTPAFAHAKVDSATPGIGSTITQAPTVITVHTLENMKPGAQSSNLFVYGPSGDLISQGDAKVGLNTPNQMSVNIKPEKDGIYVVRWLTTSADDNDPDQGAFTFTVKSSATAGNTAQQSTPAQSTANTTGKATAAQGSSPVLPAVITGIIALLLGVGVGFGVGRNQARTAQTATSSGDTQTPDKVVH